MRYCAQPSCAEKVPKGYCSAHSARPNAAIRKLYHTARWQALRTQACQEQPLCTTCEAEGYVRLGTEVDHITPHRNNLELFWDKANLQSLCRYHHGVKTRHGL